MKAGEVILKCNKCNDFECDPFVVKVMTGVSPKVCPFCKAKLEKVRKNGN